MNSEREFTYRIRHHLNQGTGRLDRGMAVRLFEARQKALARQKVAGTRFALAGTGYLLTDLILPHARALVALLGLLIGVVGISVWNDARQAAELEEIDSALLADDLPINAYLDKGFQAWLSEQSSQD